MIESTKCPIFSLTYGFLVYPQDDSSPSDEESSPSPHLRPLLTYGFLVYPQDDSSPSDEESSPSPHLRPLLMSIDDLHLRQLSFAELKETVFFVDKTRLIRDFLHGTGPQQMILQTKRGFGKTTNLDMIRRFLEIDASHNGTKETDKLSHKSYKTFATKVPNKNQFLDVFRDRPLFAKNFGEYPVIWLDFDTKGVKTHSEAGFLRHLLNNTLRSAFEDHAYLINSSMISAEDKMNVRKFLYPNSSTHDVTPRQGVALLKRLLRQQFQKDAITLADNVDARLREVIFDPEQELDEKVDVLDILIDENEPSGRMLMTCVLLPPGGSKFNHWFGKQYEGVTEDILETVVYKKPSFLNRMSQMKAWYGGYGDKFNLYSVMKYMNWGRKKFQPLWTELGSLDTFKMAFAPDCFGPKILECFVGCEITPANFSSHLEVFPQAMRSLKSLQRLAFPVEASVCTDEALLHLVEFLVDLGYLNRTGRVYRPRSSPRKEYQILKVPNLEVEDYISKLLYKTVVAETPLNGDENFRLELFEAIFGVSESQETMRRFATALATLLMTSERANQTSDVTLAHALRVHLLRPPTQFNVPYVKLGPNDADLDRGRPNFDLVFAVRAKDAPAVGFFMKVESDEKSTASDQVLSDVVNDFQLEEIQNIPKSGTVNVLVKMGCDDEICRLNYLYNSTQLDQSKQLQIKKEQVAREAREKWNKF
ncbi:uncharacterized protein [Bemisia tabaci]|uniref:uncharacterized protein isoform X3 n=1 Tax=Bemisia tabaci TaxID=7038 RepID=UPI003B287B3B